MKTLVALSKFSYLLSFLTLFLPAFVPSCCSERESAPTTDSAMAIVDSTFEADTTSKLSQKQKKEINQVEDSKEIESTFSIFIPDHENLSFLGYLWFSLDRALIWGFVIMFFWSGGLRFQNKNNKRITRLSVIGFLCLLGYVFLGREVVWGFWSSIGIAALVVMLNGLLYFRKLNCEE